MSRYVILSIEVEDTDTPDTVFGRDLAELTAIADRFGEAERAFCLVDDADELDHGLVYAMHNTRVEENVPEGAEFGYIAARFISGRGGAMDQALDAFREANSLRPIYREPRRR